MLSADVKLARYTGVAPGTTTLRLPVQRKGLSTLGAAASYPPYPPPDGGPGVPPYPTQAWLVPEPATVDRVRIALPPNQHVTSQAEVIVSVPNAQQTMGPVPNDKQLAQMWNYQPVHRGWIHTTKGDIYTLQGGRASPNMITFQGAAEESGGGGMSTTEKWAIFASVISGLALATTATIAILRYKRGR